jgi:hypothetical protein
MGQAFNGMEIRDLTCQRQNGNGNVGAGFEPARHCYREGILQFKFSRPWSILECARWIPAFAGTTMAEGSNSLRLIEIVTLLSFLHEMDEQPTHTLSPLAPGGRELERGGF